MQIVAKILSKPLPTIAVFFAMVGLSLLWSLEGPNTTIDKMPDHAESPPEAVSKNVEVARPLTEIWQWDSNNEKANPFAAESGPGTSGTSTGLSLTGVYDTIGKIQFQGDNLILDYQSRQLLESSFEHLGNQVTAEQIDEIQAILRNALPGTIGEQAAQVFGKYYDYLEATRNETLETLSVEENIELREHYLGTKLNSRLYGNEQAFQRYLKATERVQSSSELSEGERKLQLTQLKQDLDNGVFYVADSRPAELQDINDLAVDSPELQEYLTSQALALSAAHKNLDSTDPEWQQRYQQYTEQRRWVIDAALTSEDKRKQLDQLYSEYFTPEERSKIDDYIDPDAFGML